MKKNSVQLSVLALFLRPHSTPENMYLMDIHVDWACTRLYKQGAESVRKTTMNEGNLTAVHTFVG